MAGTQACVPHTLATLLAPHTSPVWLDVPGRPIRPSGQTLAPLLEALGRTGGWLDTGCEDERLREHVRGVLHQARDVLLARRDAEGAAS